MLLAPGSPVRHSAPGDGPDQRPAACGASACRRLPSARCARRIGFLLLLLLGSNLAMLRWARVAVDPPVSVSSTAHLQRQQISTLVAPVPAPAVSAAGHPLDIKKGSTAHVVAASAGLSHEHMYGRIPRKIHQTWKSKQLPGWCDLPLSSHNFDDKHASSIAVLCACVHL
eukprot:SAG31_NODE_16329_length_713_cov_1.141694_1_plen_169_part_10